MRLGLDIQTLETAERQRGIGRYVQGLIAGLLAVDDGPELHLFGFADQPPPQLAFSETSRAHYHRYPAAFDREQYLEQGVTAPLAWTQEAPPLDALLVTSPLMADILIPRHAPCPLGCLLYDLIPLLMRRRHPELMPADLWPRYQLRLELLRSYDFALAISAATRQDALTWLDWPPARIAAISAAIDARFHEAPPAPSARDSTLTRLSVRRPYLLTVSGFDARKNWEGALEAFALLPARLRQRHRLVLVCRLTAAQEQIVRGKARELGMLESLTLTNYVPDEDLPALYHGAACFLFTSRYEGFGLPVAEAMACGCPVVTADNSSLPEVADECALLADAEDAAAFATAIKQTLEQPEETASRVEAARRRAREFRWDKVAANCLAALDDFLALSAQRKTIIAGSRPSPSHDRQDAIQGADVLVQPRFLDPVGFDAELLNAFLGAAAEHFSLARVERPQQCRRAIHPLAPGVDVDFLLRNIETDGGWLWLLDTFPGPTLERLQARGLNPADTLGGPHALLEQLLDKADGVIAAPALLSHLNLVGKPACSLAPTALAAKLIGEMKAELAVPAAPGDRFEVLALGDFDGHYAHDAALEALAQLAPEWPGLRLTFAGQTFRPEELHELHRRRLAARLTDEANFAPLTSLAELQKLLSQSQLCLFLPRTGGGQLLFALAFASGCPLVAFQREDLSLASSRAMLLIDPVADVAAQLIDVVRMLRKRPALLRQLAVEARRQLPQLPEALRFAP